MEICVTRCIYTVQQYQSVELCWISNKESQHFYPMYELVILYLRRIIVNPFVFNLENLYKVIPKIPQKF